ncbi:hypothetical protein [Vreelandella sp. EE22]
MTRSKSFQWNDGFLALLACIGALVLYTPASVASAPLQTAQLHGFLSQALVITDENNFFGPSSKHAGSPEYTEIGLNASIRPYPSILLAAQVLSRRAGGETSDAKPTLDYGVVDYQLTANQQRSLGIQAGRFKNPFGLYNHTRDMAFTRPSILLPQSIYFDRSRSLGLAADGVSVYAEEHIPAGTLRFRGGIGRPQTGADLPYQLYWGTHADISSSSSSTIAQLLFEDNSGKLVAALSAADVALDVNFTGEPADFNFQPWILSLQYNEDLWSLTGEYALRKQRMQGAAPQTFDITGESWYLQYERRLTPEWSWLLRYDSLVNNRQDRSGNQFERRGSGPAYSQYADDITTGVQWMPTSNLMLAAEYHYIDGTGWLPKRDNANPWESSKHWNMLLFQLSLRF